MELVRKVLNVENHDHDLAGILSINDSIDAEELQVLHTSLKPRFYFAKKYICSSQQPSA